jgi:iron complex outermembrane receptor protein
MSHKRTAIAMASMTLLASFALASEQNSASTTELHQIRPVTVFASRFEEQATDSLPQTSYITSQEIVKSGASNVSEVLAKVAGLPTRANLDGSTNAVIDMRGYGETADNNVVVLLDGVRISEYEQSAARTSMIPLEAIDHIEITKTGNSVLYGDGANGGTINIVTKKNLDELTVASAGVASYSGYQSSIYHANKNGNNNFSLFARQYASNHYRQNAEGNEKSLGMNWIHHVASETQLGMRFFVSKEVNELPGALPLIYLNSSPRQAQVPGYRWDSLVDTNSITLFGTTKIDRVELSLDINQRIKQTSDDYSYNASSVFSGYAQPGWNQSYGTSASHANSLAINPRAKISDFLTSKNTLIVGFDYAKNTKTGDGRKTSASTANQIDFSNYAFHYQTSAYYFRDTLDLTSSDRITLGYRKQYYSQDKNLYLSNSSSPTPTNYPWQGKDSASANEIQYSKTISATLLGFVRYSENFRIPNIDDNSSSAYYDPVTYATIPLVPQKSKDVDIGANLKTDQYSAEILYFKSNIKNEIGYDPNLGNLNYDPTKREGFNLRQRLGLAKNVATRLMLKYTNAKFTEGANMGKNTPNVPPVFGNLSFDYSVSQKGQITATTRFSSSRFMSGDFDNSHAKTPGYTVQDLSYFHKEKNWSFAATLSNVTNKKYADTGIYKATFTAPYQSTVYPNFGRNFSLVGRYTF